MNSLSAYPLALLRMPRSGSLWNEQARDSESGVSESQRGELNWANDKPNQFAVFCFSSDVGLVSVKEVWRFVLRIESSPRRMHYESIRLQEFCLLQLV